MMVQSGSTKNSCANISIFIEHFFFVYCISNFDFFEHKVNLKHIFLMLEVYFKFYANQQPDNFSINSFNSTLQFKNHQGTVGSSSIVPFIGNSTPYSSANLFNTIL